MGSEIRARETAIDRIVKNRRQPIWDWVIEACTRTLTAKKIKAALEEKK